MSPSPWTKIPQESKLLGNEDSKLQCFSSQARQSGYSGIEMAQRLARILYGTRMDESQIRVPVHILSLTTIQAQT